MAGWSATSGRGVLAVTIVAYSTLVFILVWSRLAGLGQSYWHDEIVTVVNFVTASHLSMCLVSTAGRAVSPTSAVQPRRQDRCLVRAERVEPYDG